MKNVKIDLISTPEIMLDKDYSTGYLQVNFSADEPKDLAKKRPNLNLSFVIDRSGSMSGPKMEYTKQSAIEFVKNLREEDIFSLVIYDNLIETIVVPTKITKNNKSKIIDKIETIYARNSTNLFEGVAMGIELVLKNYSKRKTNRVILMSDGLANVGRTTIEDINTGVTNLIQSKSISVTTLGVGRDYNETLLEALATSTRGNYYYIENPNFITTIVSRELTGLLSLIWANTEVTFEGSPEIAITGVMGYTVTDNSSFIGEVRALDELYVIAEFQIINSGNKPFITIKVTYDDVYQNESDLQGNVIFDIPLTDNRNKVKENIIVKTNVDLFKLGSIIARATDFMKVGEYEKSLHIINKAKMNMESLQEINPSDERIPLKITFLKTMMETAINQSYNDKFGKMSSYYSYSAERQNYRKKIAQKYGL